MRASLSLMPRFNYAHEAADKFLMQLSVDRLPFNPDTALKDIGCKVYTYTEVAGHNHITLRDVAERFGSAEGCTFYRPGLDEYIVFVNDVDPSIPRLRWTLTHELSHIILRHLADNTADQLPPRRQHRRPVGELQRACTQQYRARGRRLCQRAPWPQLRALYHGLPHRLRHQRDLLHIPSGRYDQREFLLQVPRLPLQPHRSPPPVPVRHLRTRAHDCIE